MGKVFFLKGTKTVNEIFAVLGCDAVFIFSYRISRQPIGPVVQGQVVLFDTWRYSCPETSATNYQKVFVTFQKSEDFIHFASAGRNQEISMKVFNPPTNQGFCCRP